MNIASWEKAEGERNRQVQPYRQHKLNMAKATLPEPQSERLLVEQQRRTIETLFREGLPEWNSQGVLVLLTYPL